MISGDVRSRGRRPRAGRLLRGYRHQDSGFGHHLLHVGLHLRFERRGLEFPLLLQRSHSLPRRHRCRRVGIDALTPQRCSITLRPVQFLPGNLLRDGAPSGAYSVAGSVR